MTPIHIPNNSHIEIGGVEYRYLRLLKGNRFQFQDDDSGEIKIFRGDEIRDSVFEGKARLSFVSNCEDGAIDGEDIEERNFELYPEALKDIAIVRLEYVKMLDKLLPGMPQYQAVEVVLKRLETVPEHQRTPSSSTLIRLYKRWIRANRSLVSLIPDFCKRGNRVKPFGDEVEQVIQDILEEHYLCRTPCSIADLHNIILSRINQLNQRRSGSNKLRCPSKRTLYRRVVGIGQYERLLAHHGRQKADRYFGMYQKGLVAKYALDVVEIDHTLLDINLVSAQGVLIGRPNLTIALDLYSRMPVGFYLSFDAPSFASLKHCLRHAIMPKNELMDQYEGAEEDWPCYGLPNRLVLDNGREFHSKHLIESVSQLGINIEYNPIRTPRYKGAVERFFGTLNTGLIHTLPGTTFSNIQAKGDYDSEGKASLTLGELEEQIVIFITKIYALKPHGGTNQFPIDSWKMSVKKHPVRIVSNIDDLDTLLCCVEKRVMTSTGIKIFGLDYYSEELKLLRHKLKDRSSEYKTNPSVKLKYDPDDIGHIYVADEITCTYLKVPATIEYAKDLTLWQHKYIKKKLRDELAVGERANATQLATARERIFQITKEAVYRKSKLRKDQARLLKEEKRKAKQKNVEVPPTSGSAEPMKKPTVRDLREWKKQKGWKVYRTKSEGGSDD